MPRHQPPLPPGPPPRSPFDSYNSRSGPPQYDDYYSNRDRDFERDRGRDRDRDMYTFGSGGGNSRSYPPRSPPRYSNYAPGRTPDRPRSPGYRSSRNDRGGDSYRPAQNDFHFRHEAPPAIANSYDTYRPVSPPRQRRDNGYNRNNNHRQNNSNFRANNNHHVGGQRGGYRGRGAPRLASDRDFLKTNREPTPELMPGMVADESHVKYIPLDDVSDSSEAEMDIDDSDEDNNDVDEQPKKKQPRTMSRAADGDSVPRWSNPDPYTALPPPDASAEKKKDIVKLIKKARVGAGSAFSTSKEEAADDFISFDDDEVDDDDATGVVGAPTGPRALTQYDNQHSVTVKGMIQSSDQKNTRELDDATSSHSQNHTHNAYSEQPSKRVNETISRDQPVATYTPPALDLTSNPELGSRKRTIRDEIKETPSLRQALAMAQATGRVRDAPAIHKSSQGKKPAVSGNVVKEWRGTDTPWIEIDHSETTNMGLRLHKEIMDFYYYVKPKPFEELIRRKLVDDLNERVAQGFSNRGAYVETFGSFPAGLYLPTADMDIVVLSQRYMKQNSNRDKVMGQSKSEVRQFGSWIEKQRLPQRNSMEMILGAKVPLVKYVDRVTGLKVDISFENNTGLVANKTFQDWKKQYPAMPIIVTLVKHLLAMRGLNEPVNGGIGGFSVICLVVSLLQNMPAVQSRSMVAEHNLGEILMEFFDLYGNNFNWTTTAIQFDPPGYVSKARLGNLPYQKQSQINKEKICIIDPNNSSNDISGGSSNTKTILDCFSACYHDLQRLMGDLQYGKRPPQKSLLACILAGNYSSFEMQRDHLDELHGRLYGSTQN